MDDTDDEANGVCLVLMYLVEVVVFLGFEEVEGLPLLFSGSSQQVVEDMVVPTKTSKTCSQLS